MSLPELIHSYDGRKDLEELLAEFIAWLTDQDIYLCEPIYEEEIFDVVGWAMRTWNKPIKGTAKECPDCGHQSHFVEDDYKCVDCRLKETMTYHNNELSGVDEDGNTLYVGKSHSGREIVYVRQPIPDHFDYSLMSSNNLAFFFLRYLNDKTPAPMGISKKYEVPF